MYFPLRPHCRKDICERKVCAHSPGGRRGYVGCCYVAKYRTAGIAFSLWPTPQAFIVVMANTAGTEVARFMPAMKGKQTAMFVLRLARDKVGWALSTIGDVDHTASGTL